MDDKIATTEVHTDRNQIQVAINCVAKLTYVTNDDNSVTVIDEHNNPTQTAVGGSGMPTDIIVHPTTGTTYVLNRGVSSVTSIAKNGDVSNIPMWTGPISYGALAIDTTNNKLYVAPGAAYPGLLAIDLDSLQTNPVHGPRPAFLEIAINPVTNKIYAFGGDILLVVDVARNATSWSSPVSHMGGLLIDDQANMVYVSYFTPDDAGRYANPAVLVIDGSTEAVVSTIAGIQSVNLFSPSLNRVFGVSRGRSNEQGLAVIDTTTNEVSRLPFPSPDLS